MDRAWADNYEQTVILSGHDASGVVARESDGLLCVGRRGDLMAKERWLHQGIVLNKILE